MTTRLYNAIYGLVLVAQPFRADWQKDYLAKEIIRSWQENGARNFESKLDQYGLDENFNYAARLILSESK